MTLDITPLRNAVDRLRQGLDRYHLDITDILIRDGLVRRFEFTYELSHKMLKRFLVATSPSPAQFDEMSFAGLWTAILGGPKGELPPGPRCSLIAVPTRTGGVR